MSTYGRFNMILTGFIGFLDPPKESAAGAIKRMNEAGIRVIVLTGDNADVYKRQLYFLFVPFLQ